ncbi:CbrC family protein [Streptomyces sp. NPDC059385]|uniref:CbrC family protein n=1 Tax=Streptomyces sp. NPDC059385 TaxID=3346817 RepID=UPI00369CA3F2
MSRLVLNLSDTLPQAFVAAARYHPDPVASGSVRESTETCACCNRSTGWIYTVTFHTAQEISGRFCPWCIADGSAAERFEGDVAVSDGQPVRQQQAVHRGPYLVRVAASLEGAAGGCADSPPPPTRPACGFSCREWSRVPSRARCRAGLRCLPPRLVGDGPEIFSWCRIRR